jgi:hypothetical protein
MTNSRPVPSQRSARQLLGLTSALLALQILNLTVFDDLRTDPSAGEIATFTKPQHLASLIAVLVVFILVAARHRAAAWAASSVAWIEIAAFTFFHGVPVEIGPSKPYWGQGTGDTLQWIGFVSILACGAALAVVAHRQRTPASVAPVALSLPFEPNAAHASGGNAS